MFVHDGSMVDSVANTGVVAVTRNGLGDFWIFDSFEDADTHPLVQYGDVICRGPDHIFSQFTFLELPDLLRRLDDEMFRSEVLMKTQSQMTRQEMLQRYSGRIWQKMVGIASRPPENPGEIIKLIVRDRKLSIKERKMSKTTDKTEEKGEKKEPAAPKKIGGHEMSEKITLLVDKDGKPYGPDNNPKRAGSKSADRFALYKNGMTVEDALAAGVLAADIPYDENKKFIKVG